jgi:hypothetical protein
MTQWRGALAVGALFLLGCGEPTRFSDAQIEDFVAASGLPNATSPYYGVRLADLDLQGFSVGFGQVVPCPLLSASGASGREDECRSGMAVGLRIGQRIGWLRREEEGVLLPDDGYDFDILGAGDPVLDGLFWAELRAAVEGRDPGYYHVFFKERVVRDPDTPLPPLHRVADELVEWIWPPGADLLLDNPLSAGDPTLVEKLAALPVYQGDPYAEQRARAQLLLSGPG